MQPNRITEVLNAPKLRGLRYNPTVALTIDTEVHPPKMLLIRGRAERDYVDGISDEYLRATDTYQMTPEQRVEWEAEGVRSTTTGWSGSSGVLGSIRSLPGNVSGNVPGNVSENLAVRCREPTGGNVPEVNTATMGRR